MAFTFYEIDRGYLGGGDGRAINRHAYREYGIVGAPKITITLDKNLSVLPPYFALWANVRGLNGSQMEIIPHAIKDGETWKKAIEEAHQATVKYLRNRSEK